MTEIACGVYWDLDNAVWCLHETVDGRDAVERTRKRVKAHQPLDLPQIDIPKVLAVLPAEGHRRVHRAYAPWSAPWTRGYAKTLGDAGAHLTEVGTQTGLKNGADIAMALDIADDVQAFGLRWVLIVSGDSDFAPLILWCRRRGVRVHVVAATSGRSRRLKLLSDGFTSLPAVDRPRAETPAAEAAVAEAAAAGKPTVAPAPAPAPAPVPRPVPPQADPRAAEVMAHLQELVPPGSRPDRPGPWVRRDLVQFRLRQWVQGGIPALGFASWRDALSSWGPGFEVVGTGADLLVRRRPASESVTDTTAYAGDVAAIDAGRYLDAIVGQLQSLAVSQFGAEQFDRMVRVGAPDLPFHLGAQSILGWAQEHPAISLVGDAIRVADTPAYPPFVTDPFVSAVLRQDVNALSSVWLAVQAGRDPWEGILSPGIGELTPAAREVLWWGADQRVRTGQAPTVPADVTLPCECEPSEFECSLALLTVDGLVRGGGQPPTLETMAANHLARRVVAVAPRDIDRAAAAVLGPHPTVACALAVRAALAALSESVRA